MARIDEEREFRLRPPKPRVTRNEGAAWSSGFRLLMHYARSSRKSGNRAPGGKGNAARPYYQRCAIRVTYLKNKVPGSGRLTDVTWHVRAPRSQKTPRDWKPSISLRNSQAGRPKAISSYGN